jgi:hypothetical protein
MKRLPIGCEIDELGSVRLKVDFDPMQMVIRSLPWWPNNAHYH